MTPRYLIDTHVLLWALNNDSRLSASHRSIFANDANVVVSAVTILEVAIKKSLGKLVLGVDLVAFLQEKGIEILPMTEKHAARVEHLPRLHADPFDRVLIAQAQIEGMTLVTADADIARYDVLLA